MSEQIASTQSITKRDALKNLWDEISSRPLYAPPNFFRFLKLKVKTKTTFMSSKNLKIIAPKWKVNDCQSCTDICCIGSKSKVLLRLEDIATLMDIGRTDLIDCNFDVIPTDSPEMHRYVHSAAWSIFPKLHQNQYHACQALSPEGKCSIYPHWPQSCARFPYSLDPNQQEFFYSSRCNSFWIRPDKDQEVKAMTIGAVASYNHLIKDQILLSYASVALRTLGFTQFLNETKIG
ncbi:MAG: YkgJ family cysteine cluster protein [Myxococcota bacterium]|nr:YkgJ family cysteine cluster protein [Myxococcota bacterium]